MNICKKIISIICASVFTFSCFGFNANAKVIEPEIVKTETWTTSYFIDDNMNTLYPYIQCEADIYNDGTIKLYMWNTHEWDGFATVKKQVNIIQFNDAVSTDSYIYSLKQNGYFISNDQKYELKEQNDLFNNLDLNYYPSEYSQKSVSNLYSILVDPYGAVSFGGKSIKGVNTELICTSTPNSSYYLSIPISFTSAVDIALPQMITYSGKDIKNLYATYIPKEDPTGIYNFRLLGHSIIITPELLSGNIIAEPELTEQERYIKQLEEENSKLKTEIEFYKKLDFDGDGLLTNADAQMILVYYTDSLVGKTTGKVEDYGEYIKLIGN